MVDSLRAVVLLSGGLDSATALAWAMGQGYECHALTVDYGQRHVLELKAAARVARALGAREHRIVPLDLSWIGGSALTDREIEIPRALAAGIPLTYVPARNTVFLALALGWAEVLEARHLVIGVNAVDYSGYPDCRPEFIQAFARLSNLATRAGVQGQEFMVHTPLMEMSKANIIRTGLVYGVEYGMTLSCYDPGVGGIPCRTCDSCRIRAQGFAEAGLSDPALALANLAHPD